MDFDIHFAKKNYALLDAKSALKLSKLRGGAHPLAALKKQAPKKQEDGDEETLKTTEMKTGFDPLSMMRQSAAPKKSKEVEESKEPVEAKNTAIEDKVNEEREKYEKLQEQVTAMKRAEFQEWNVVKDRAIAGKLLAIGQGSEKKEDDSTIMMYMGDEDPEAGQGQGKAENDNRAGDTCAHGIGQEQTRDIR